MKKQYISPKIENSEFVLAARIACGSNDLKKDEDDQRGMPKHNGWNNHPYGGNGNHKHGHGH